MRKKDTSESFTGMSILLGAGALFAAFALMINQQYPVMINMASILSPTGGRGSIFGFRIKHWVTGVLVGVLGVMMMKTPATKSIGLFLMGTSMLLVFDEYEAVWKTLTTGEYP